MAVGKITLKELNCSFNEAAKALQELSDKIMHMGVIKEGTDKAEADALRVLRAVCEEDARENPIKVPPRYDYRTEEGHKLGLSACAECGGTWNWRVPFEIPISDNRGVFPVCQECVIKISHEEILCHVHDLLIWRNRERQKECHPLLDLDTILSFVDAWLIAWAKTGKKMNNVTVNDISQVADWSHRKEFWKV